MTSSIFFSNPGHMDILAATTLGVNAKTNDSPIGYFGTGLKYAIATLLRNGHVIRISIGKTLHTFSASPMESRGTTFEIVEMMINGKERRTLGFTTALGKNWGIREAYREIYSNMLDEGGEFTTSHRGEGFTTIEVQGKEFSEFHPKRDDASTGIILPTNLTDKLVYKNEAVEIYDHPGEQFYYKGFATLKINTLQTYNYLDGMQLTEDRTVDIWSVRARVMQLACYHELPTSVMEKLLLAPSNCFENSLNFSYEFPAPSNLEAMESLVQQYGELVNPSARKRLFELGRKNKKNFKVVPGNDLTPDERDVVESCVLLLYEHGLKMVWSLEIVEDLPDDQWGHWDRADRKIRIVRRILASRRQFLCTLLEEVFHARSDAQDFTREFQNYFLTSVAALLLREPLYTAGTNLSNFCRVSSYGKLLEASAAMMTLPSPIIASPDEISF